MITQVNICLWVDVFPAETYPVSASQYCKLTSSVCVEETSKFISIKMKLR